MLFYSNVFNLVDWSLCGIDPCTLMHVQNIKLADISANNLQGPKLDIYLRFNQFNSADYGFGVGWELSLTRIDEETDAQGLAVKTLVLADGSRYRFASETGTDVVLKYKQTRAFTFQKNGSTEYVVKYKSGVVEFISRGGRLSKIVCPNKASIGFFWGKNGFEIFDEDSRAILETQIMPRPDGATFTTHRVTTPRGIFDYRIDDFKTPDGTTIGSLTQVTHAENGSSVQDYAMSYDLHNKKYMMLKKIEAASHYPKKTEVAFAKLSTPPGLAVDVFAAATMDVFVEEKKGVDFTVRKTYDFSDGNYLGYGKVVSWVADADNLENLAADMSFTSRESVGWMGNKKIVRVTGRKYNKFYLLKTVDWEPKPKERYKSEIYEYSLSLDKGIAAQVASFMLPIKYTERRTLKKKDGTVRDIDTVIESSYDDYENITKYKSADGISTDYAYYPAEGEGDACPADPGNFVCYLKKKTTHAAIPSNGDKVWGYEYLRIPDTNAVMVSREIYFVIKKGSYSPILHTIEYEYEYEDPIFLGQPRTIKYLMPHTADCIMRPLVTQESLEDAFVFYKEEGNGLHLIRIKTLTGYDGCKTEKRVSVNRLTGDVICSQNENGIQNYFKYDCLGRIVKETKSFLLGTDARTIEQLTVYDDPKNMVTIKNSFCRTWDRTLCDAMGNTVSEFMVVLKKDSDGKDEESYPLLMTQREFNALNQLRKITEHDYQMSDPKPGGTVSPLMHHKKITTTIRNIYDELTAQQVAGESAEIYQYDTLVSDEYGSSLRIGYWPGQVYTDSLFNMNGLLARREVRSPLSTGPADVVEEYRYDGFSRLVFSSETGKEAFSYSYDDFDREVDRTGTESGIRTSEYAAHSREKLVTSITIDNDLVAERVFDGLDREISSSVAGVETSYDYTGSAIYEKAASRTIENDGKKRFYTYDALLGVLAEQITSATDGPLSSFLSKSTYTYANEQLERSVNEQRKYYGEIYEKFWWETVFKYDQFGGVIEEEAGRKGGADRYTIKRKLTVRQVIVEESVKLSDNAELKVVNSFSLHGKLKSKSVFFNNDQIVYSDAALKKFDIVQDVVHYFWFYIEGNRYEFPAGFIKKKTYSNKYSLVDGVSYSHFYAVKDDAGKISSDFNYEKILDIELKYDAKKRLISSAYDFHIANVHSWKEYFYYTDTGRFFEWKRTGNMVYRDEYEEIISEEKYTLDKLGNIKEIDSAKSGQGNVSTYFYNNYFQLTAIKNNLPIYKSKLPKNISFQYGATGELTEKTYSTWKEVIQDFEKVTQKYDCGGEDNAVSITESVVPKNNESATQETFIFNGYDAQGRIVDSTYKSIVSQDEHQPAISESILQSYYSDGKIFFERSYEKADPVLSEFKIFNYFDNEVACIIKLTAATGTPPYEYRFEILPCLNAPDGSLVAQGRPLWSHSPVIYKGENKRCGYRFFISGQNAYGKIFYLDYSLSFYLRGMKI